MVHRMSDSAVASFVSNSVISERGPTDRLAQAFHALVPDADRQRQLLAIAQTEVAASELGQEAAFQDLWQKVEAMLTSYSDEKFVSDAYARELSGARARAVDVEAVERRPAGAHRGLAGSVADASLRTLDTLLLADLLRIEEDGAALARRRRDGDHPRRGPGPGRLLRPGAAPRRGGHDRRRPRVEARRQPARAVLDRLGRGAMMRHAAKQLRTADDASYERLKRLAHGIGPAVIAPLAEALSAEQDARSRRRLRDILVRVRRGRPRVGAAVDERGQLGSAAHRGVPAARVRRRRRR